MIRLDVEHSISDKLKVCWQRDDALEMNQPSSADLVVVVRGAPTEHLLDSAITGKGGSFAVDH